MLRILKIALACAFLSGCGGGGSDGNSADPSDGNNEESGLQVNQNYTGATGTASIYEFTMPIDSVLDVSAVGTQISIYDDAMNPVEETFFDTRDAQVNLNAGNYFIKFSFWSSNSKHASVYSPALLDPGMLPLLRNGTYSATSSRSEYFLLKMPMDGNVDFTAAGTNVSIYDRGLNKIDADAHNHSPVHLVAGDYIVKFLFWSSNAKSVTVFSPALDD